MDFEVLEEESGGNFFLQIIYCIGSVIALHATYKLWIEERYFNKKVRADGKVVLITEGTHGVGKLAAVELAKRGAKIIIGCRIRKTSKLIQKEIIAKSDNENIHLMELNLASIKSIKQFTKEFMEQEKRLDILINNAEFKSNWKLLTEDGLDMQMGITYVGHFILTLLLLKIMVKSFPCRIIQFAKLDYMFGGRLKTNLDDFFANPKEYNQMDIYAQTHLANILFTRELSRRLHSSGITINTFNPEYDHSYIFQKMGKISPTFTRNFFSLISYILWRTKNLAAQKTLHAALDFNLQTISGVFYDGFDIGILTHLGQDDDLAKKLFDRTEEFTGIRFNDLNLDLTFNFSRLLCEQ